MHTVELNTDPGQASHRWLQSNQHHTGKEPVRRSQRDKREETENMPINAALTVCSLANATDNVDATALAAFQHEGMTNVADFARLTD